MRPFVPDYATINGHIFFILLKDKNARNALLEYLNHRGIAATFHYIPLHSAPLGKEYGYKEGDLPITEEYAGRLLRLPLHCNVTDDDVRLICQTITDFFEGRECG